MKNHKRVILCLAVVAVLLGAAVAFLEVSRSREQIVEYATELNDHCSYELDVPYLDREACTMDIAWDTNEGTAPLVVIVHGGGWTGGDKDTCRPVQIALTGVGYTVANINYDLVPDVTILEQAEQVKTAVRYLVEHAEQYEIDPSQIVLMGYSAGGHLAALTTEQLTAESSDLQISACIDVFGPTALEYYITTVENQVSDWFITTPEAIDGVQNGNLLEEIAKIDPTQQIPGNMPPTLIIQGNEDTLVPQIISEHFYQALQEKEIPSSLSIIQGMGHELDLDLTYDVLCTFLQEHTPV